MTRFPSDPLAELHDRLPSSVAMSHYDSLVLELDAGRSLSVVYQDNDPASGVLELWDDDADLLLTEGGPEDVARFLADRAAGS